ncbi:MAG: TIM-barrel domain-containing protein [Kiritimatiellia bacterium]
MQDFTTRKGDGFLLRKGHEQIWITPWGKNALRVRITREAQFLDLPNGLLDQPLVGPCAGDVQFEASKSAVKLTNGNITVAVSGPQATITYTRTSDGSDVLKERLKTTSEHYARIFSAEGSTWHIEQRFFADDDEKLYGMGQRQHGYLNQKGCVLDLMHRNTEVSIPFMVSSKGYGFLWNHPGLGRADLARNEMRWVADAAHQVDYYIVVEDAPATILQRYAEVTGFPSEFPEWAAGFWQCKLRYKTQDELLTVAREYHRRKLPVSVMVIDFHHWSKMGDWSFDPACWPDPAAMVRELKNMGMECMISVWPTVDWSCSNFKHMQDHGLLLRNERGMPMQNGANVQSFYDATNPEARTFLWDQIKKGYVEHGIKLFWLDTMEPELVPLEFDNTRYYLGNGKEVTGLYPRCHQQAFYEGLRAEGEAAPLTLGRSAWVGSQQYGSAVWSADIPSTWDSLRRQVAGGLNIALSGIPYWTTDIGGFHGGDIDDPGFRELLIRWFQYGVFCPIMRVHGVRRQSSRPPEDPGKADPNHPGVPNEVWSYGEDACEVLSEQIRIRDRLKPYIMAQAAVAQATGLPPMRPLFVDFAADVEAWDVEDQFMFGPDILVAPVLAAGMSSRPVYLPKGTRWRNAWTGAMQEGGATVTVATPIEQIPVFIREGSDLPLRG